MKQRPNGALDSRWVARYVLLLVVGSRHWTRIIHVQAHIFLMLQRRTLKLPFNKEEEEDGFHGENFKWVRTHMLDIIFRQMMAREISSFHFKDSNKLLTPSLVGL